MRIRIRRPLRDVPRHNPIRVPRRLAIQRNSVDVPRPTSQGVVPVLVDAPAPGRVAYCGAVVFRGGFDLVAGAWVGDPAFELETGAGERRESEEEEEEEEGECGGEVGEEGGHGDLVLGGSWW